MRPERNRRSTVQVPRNAGPSGLPPDPKCLDFRPLASLVAGHDAPAWLTEFFEDFVSILLLNVAVDAKAPTRKELKQKLESTAAASATVRHALDDSILLEALASDDFEKISNIKRFQEQLALLEACATSGAQRFTSPDGKVKPGRGRAFSQATFSPQVYCAVVIAETWNYMRGEYPAPRTSSAQRAAALYWQLSGAEPRSHMCDPNESWRPYLQKAMHSDATTSLKEFRSIVRRHLQESHHVHQMLAAENSDKNTPI